MWEDVCLALSGVGFGLGLLSLAVGLVGTLAPDSRWLPRSFR